MGSTPHSSSDDMTSISAAHVKAARPSLRCPLPPPQSRVSGWSGRPSRPLRGPPSSRRITRTAEVTARCSWLCSTQRRKRMSGGLASLDMLRAEQLRAYSAHLAMYSQPHHQPAAHPAAAAAYAAQQAYYSSASAPSSYYPQAAPAPPKPNQRGPRHAHAGPGPSTTAASKPTATAEKASSSTSTTRTSRSPSLTRSSASRQSSVDHEAVKTPSEEKFQSLLRATSTSPRVNDVSSFPSAAQAAHNTLPPIIAKRKRPVGGIREEDEDEDDSTRARFVRRTTPPGAVNSRRTTPKETGTSPRSLKHILNDDLLRPFGSTRVATSDVRSSSSSDEA